MSTELVFSPADLVDLLGVSKSTLFRWEKEGLLPPTTRDFTNARSQRVYTQEHVASIVETQQEDLAKQITQAEHAADHNAPRAKSTAAYLLQANSLRKFLSGNEFGLTDLANYPNLDPKVITSLVRIASEQLRPDDPLYARILKIASDQSQKLAARRATP